VIEPESLKAMLIAEAQRLSQIYLNHDGENQNER
jgi:hypothetical protein